MSLTAEVLLVDIEHPIHYWRKNNGAVILDGGCSAICGGRSGRSRPCSGCRSFAAMRRKSGKISRKRFSARRVRVAVLGGDSQDVSSDASRRRRCNYLIARVAIKEAWSIGRGSRISAQIHAIAT